MSCIRFAVVALIVGLPACSRTPGSTGAATASPARDGEFPAWVSVVGGPTSLGFASDAKPAAIDEVASFRISQTPVTARHLAACRRAGACSGGQSAACEVSTPSEVLGPQATLEGLEDLPATCVERAEAEAFCRWIGGELPTPAAWLLAARGPTPQLYAWGSDEATCARHPEADGPLATSGSCCAGIPGCEPERLAAVGRHPAGASASGMQDVLLARGELVATSSGLCDGASCLVSGARGAPRGLRAVKQGETAPVYTFRCMVKS